MNQQEPIIWMIDGLGPGGAEQLMPTILKHLGAAGFNVRVCALQVRNGNPIANDLKQLGVPVDMILVPSLRHPFNLLRILGYLRSHHPLILHTQLEFSDILGTVAARLLGIPTVSTLHTLDIMEAKKSATWRLRLRWFILRNLGTRILAVSEETRKHHLSLGGFREQQIVTLHNGIEIPRFKNIDMTVQQHLKQELKIPADCQIIITVAVLREPKGIQYMIRALPAILAQNPNTHYLVVGAGPYGATLQSLVNELAVQHHVTFAGHRTDIPALLSLGDVFVLPTLQDALPTVLIESLAAEVPIVASNVGGVPEIVTHEVNGLLVPSGDPSALTHACLQILKDRNLKAQLVQAGNRVVHERFNISVQIDQLSRIYKDVSESDETDK